MDADKLVTNAYYSSKSNSRRVLDNLDYSSDVIPMIENFDLVNLMSNVSKGDEFDNGGFVVITDHQYIAGYNLGYGMRSHEVTFACITCELLKGSRKIHPENCLTDCAQCVDTYFTGRIHCEERNYGMSFNVSRLSENGDIKFEFISFTNGQLESFRAFYDDYNDIIKRYGLPVSIKLPKDNLLYTKVYDDLTPLLQIIEARVDENKKIPEAPEGEKIIGVPNNSSIKKTSDKRRIIKRTA